MKKFIFCILALCFVAGCSDTIGNNEQKEESNRLEKRFKRIDADKNGKINLKEWNTFYELRFKKKDKDKDGSLSETEFYSR